jgi:hypothetical protein
MESPNISHVSKANPFLTSHHSTANASFLYFPFTAKFSKSCLYYLPFLLLLSFSFEPTPIKVFVPSSAPNLLLCICGNQFYVPIWLGHGAPVFGQILFWMFLDEINI